MKILMVNINDLQGGASRAAYRLHKALLNENINSIMLVQNKKSDDFTVLTTAKNKLQECFNFLRPTIDQLPVKLYKFKIKTLFSPSWIGNKNVLKIIDKINPDIVHLHWICGGMIKIEDIAKIKAPIVWSLHDMWAFTGGCHYDEECGRYEKECGNCKVLGSSKKNDLSKKVFLRKQKIFSKKDMIIIEPSRWLSKCAKKSVLLKNNSHVTLPNLIDTTIFKPFDKQKARELWNLPQDKKIILFGAMSATSDPRKGFKELTLALQKIKNSNDIHLVVFGSSKPKNAPDFGFKTLYLEYLHDNISLVTLYNAVDVMVVPSLQENLSNSIMESLACATPVVAFDVGGNRDMIEHRKNGYLAKPFDSADLAKGIEWILNLDKNRYNELCNNAREKVLREFDSKIVVKKYIKIYEEILRKRTGV